MTELAIVDRSFAPGPSPSRATVERADGERLVLRWAESAAPGTRLRAELAGGRRFGLKVLRCVRRADGFELQVRLFDAPAAVRDAIARGLTGARQAGLPPAGSPEPQATSGAREPSGS